MAALSALTWHAPRITLKPAAPEHSLALFRLAASLAALANVAQHGIKPIRQDPMSLFEPHGNLDVFRLPAIGDSELAGGRR